MLHNASGIKFDNSFIKCCNYLNRIGRDVYVRERVPKTQSSEILTPVDNSTIRGESYSVAVNRQQNTNKVLVSYTNQNLMSISQTNLLKRVLSAQFPNLEIEHMKQLGSIELVDTRTHRIIRLPMYSLEAKEIPLTTRSTVVRMCLAFNQQESWVNSVIEMMKTAGVTVQYLIMYRTYNNSVRTYKFPER